MFLIKKILFLSLIAAFIASSNSIYANTTLNDGLVAYYQFNGNVLDSSGNDNDGTVYGATLSVDRSNNINAAYDFDGKDDYIEVQNNESLQINETITISLWAKRKNINHTDILLEKGGDWNVGETNYGVALHSNYSLGHMFYFYFNNGWMGCRGVTDNNWHHYVAIATHNQNEPILYIDGARQKITFSGGRKIIDLYPSSRNLHIGSQIGYNYFGSATIDEIRIHRRSLTDSEINLLYYGNSCLFIDTDNDGVIDQWDQCANTPLNSYVNRNGCPLIENSAISGRILMKGQPLVRGTATLIQSGELFQKSALDINGCFKFDRVAEDKSVNIMIRKPTE